MRTVGTILVQLASLSLALAAGLPPVQSATASNLPVQTEKSIEQRIADATAMFKGGKVDDAVAAFEQLHKDFPKSYESLSWLGFLYLRANRAAEAIPLLEQANLQRPSDLEVLNNLGNAYLATRQYERALLRYQAVIKVSPHMFEPHYNSGTIYLQRKQFAKAVYEFRVATRLKPDDPYVQNNLGVAYESMKNLPLAAVAFKRAAEIQPANQTFERNAGLAMSRLHQPEALPYLEKALGDGTDAAVALALGEAYAQAGNHDVALKYYEGLRTVEANNPTFWFNLAVLRGQGDDEAGAEQAYRRVLELNPSDLDTLNNLGLLLYKQKKYADALTLFDKLSGLAPGSLATKVNLASAAANSGDLNKAIEAWKEVIRTDPNRQEVRLDLANALWETGAVDEARYHYLQILAHDKNNPEALNGIGLCHLRANKLPQAEAAFRSAIEAKSTYAAAYNNLAITLERMNQVGEAIKILEKGRIVAPDSEDIRKNLDRMRTGG